MTLSVDRYDVSLQTFYFNIHPLIRYLSQSLREHPVINEQLLELSQGFEDNIWHIMRECWRVWVSVFAGLDFVNSAKMYGKIIILERYLKTKKELKKQLKKHGYHLSFSLSL